jgi:uncharacterized protein YaiI (UPF0178 family)
MPVVMVSNTSLDLPPSKLIEVVLVHREDQAADEYIKAHCEGGDMAITADIPLAAALVEQRLVVINPRGDLLDRESVRERLSMRNLMSELRQRGFDTRSDIKQGKRRIKLFAEIFDRELTKLIRDGSEP